MAAEGWCGPAQNGRSVQTYATLRSRPKKDLKEKKMTIQASESKILCPIIKVFIPADGVEEWSIRSVFNLEVSKCDTTVPLETKLFMILLDSLKFFKYIFSSKLLMLILKKTIFSCVVRRVGNQTVENPESKGLQRYGLQFCSDLHWDVNFMFCAILLKFSQP